MEQFDIYDCRHGATGRTSFLPKELKRGEYRLVIHLCIFNSRGQMLIQRRQESTGKWPGLWDITVSGCAQAGESAAEAAMREASEELGIRVDLNGVPVSFSVTFSKGFDDFFVIRRDDIEPAALTLQEDEVSQIKWAEKPEILGLIEGKKFVPYFPAFIEMLFSYNNAGDVLSE